jgi:hypothetical protein
MIGGVLNWCRYCGELLALHMAPCLPGQCVSKDCTERQVDEALGLCRVHLEMVHAQLGRAR